MVTSETAASESAYPLFRENSLQNENKNIIISTISESSFSDELNHYDQKQKQLAKDMLRSTKSKKAVGRTLSHRVRIQKNCPKAVPGRYESPYVNNSTLKPAGCHKNKPSN